MKTSHWIARFFIALLLPFVSTTAFADSKTDAIAIDVLLNPDATMVAHAKAANARLRQNYPEGFALDADHAPHITITQRFVRRADLEQVKAAVAKVIAGTAPSSLQLRSTGYYYFPYQGLGLAGITIAPTPTLLEFQQKVIAAVAPFTVEVGTGEAFVPRADGQPIVQQTVDYVNGFVPNQTGGKYNPHVTVGFGHEAFVKELVAAPFDSFTFTAPVASIYQLGEYGTAQKELWTSGPADPLSSWNDGPTKKSIVDFVERVTREGSPDFVPVAERIATFDNDGCLWAEQPLYFQLFFALDRLKALAPQHPDWANKEPFASLIKGDVKGALAGGEPALAEIVMATHAGVTTEEFSKAVSDWVVTARHPVTKQPFTAMIYQPMLELLEYLRANDFKTFIVSGGGVDFMRVFADSVYGIPPEQVVGSTGKVKFELQDGKPALVKLPEIQFIDDNVGKPVGIHQFIGRRPIAAFGNSDGDLQMLQWTCIAEGPRFCLYVHHTDGEREWAYDRESHIGKLDKGLDEAKTRGWTVVSMKDDWKKVFAFE